MALLLFCNGAEQANDYFSRASILAPENLTYAFAKLQSGYFIDHNQFDKAAAKLIQHLMSRYPSHPVVLNYAALLAYQQGHYARAISLWQLLLSKMPANSPTTVKIESMLKQAQQKNSTSD